jgi:hypothetical protein
MGNASALAGLLLMFGAASPANAQPATVEGAYQRLSTGNAKIARVLYDAQVANTPSGATTTASGPSASKTLTIDQIAAMKQGQGWGQVFQSMKALGLLAEKNLGQVVSRYQHRTGTGAVTTATRNAGGLGSGAAVSASYDDTSHRDAARADSGTSGPTK